MRTATCPIVLLLALSSGFTLSQAFRTMGAVLAVPLAQTFSLDSSQLGIWAAAFHLTFALMQLPLGVALDTYGLRRVVLAVFPFAFVGAGVCATAQGYAALILGQALIGFGCAPAFLACTVFITRHFAPERFTALSGMVMSFSNIGILATGTPLAWLIERVGWRGSYAAMAALALLAWLLIAWRVREPGGFTKREASYLSTFRELGPLLRMPHTAGLLSLAMVCYAAFITLRGLWMGPMLHERHGLDLIDLGNAAIVVTLAGFVSPSLFGSLDRGGMRRIRLLIWCPIASAALFLLLAFSRSIVVDLGVPIIYALLAGFAVLMYGYARSAYPVEAIGRAMSLVNTAIFFGVALMQSLTGVVANWAGAHGMETSEAAFITEALMLIAGVTAFVVLPRARAVSASPRRSGA